MKKEKQSSENKIRRMVVKYSELPLLIVFESKNNSKEYVLKTNTEQTKLLLNKKEY